MQPIIINYQQAENRYHSDWHTLCVNLPAYERWRAKKLFKKGRMDLAFSGLAAQSYSELFKLTSSELPYCTSSNVIKISTLAKTLFELLPSSDLLPGEAKKIRFREALQGLNNWKPSDLQSGVSGRGDPVRRWMIGKITEEFCYGTASQPTVSLIGDLIRLGWPKVQDRSIRNTLTEELLKTSMDVANDRRMRMNQATATAHQAISKITAKNFKQEQVIPKLIIKETSSGSEIISEMERLAATIPEDDIRQRALSFMQALRDEASYPQGNTGEGN